LKFLTIKPEVAVIFKTMEIGPRLPLNTMGSLCKLNVDGDMHFRLYRNK